MKIYTKTGDDGTTSLVGGTRISKDDIRLEAYGTVDELGAFVALLRDSDGLDEACRAWLDVVAERLMRVEGLLATEDESEVKKYLPQITENDVQWLEDRIDEMTEEVGQLKSLVIPGGHALSDKAHVCRTVCRRAERAAVRLSKEQEINTMTIKYLNRLSDFFFSMARLILKHKGVTEKTWKSS